jgi:hypothetical protein
MTDGLLAYAILRLASAVGYLTAAVVTLAVVGLAGYRVALRKARS